MVVVPLEMRTKINFAKLLFYLDFCKMQNVVNSSNLKIKSNVFWKSEHENVGS